MKCNNHNLDIAKVYFIYKISSIIVLINIIYVEFFKHYRIEGHENCLWMFIPILMFILFSKNDYNDTLCTFAFYILPLSLLYYNSLNIMFVFLYILLNIRFGIIYEAKQLFINFLLNIFSYFFITYYILKCQINWAILDILFFALSFIIPYYFRKIYEILNIEKINNEKKIKELKYSYELLMKRANFLEQLSKKDYLTNLYNHKCFHENLEMLIEMANDINEKLTIFIMDLDYFKQFNDTYGHQKGDELLKEFSNILGNELGYDNIYRYGGDEFAAILYGVHKEEAKIKADKIIKIINDTYFVGECRKCKKCTTCINKMITVSLGIAEYPRDSSTKDELIYLADSNMYTNKKIKKLEK